MTLKNKQGLLNALRTIKKDIPELGFGMCYNVKLVSDKSYQPQLVKLFRKWKHFSGHVGFPVEGRSDKHYVQNNMFSKTTKYGRLRNNLLNFMIKELSKKEGWDD
jgi:hypothetical protein